MEYLSSEERLFSASKFFKNKQKFYTFQRDPLYKIISQFYELRTLYDRQNSLYFDYKLYFLIASNFQQLISVLHLEYLYDTTTDITRLMSLYHSKIVLYYICCFIDLWDLLNAISNDTVFLKKVLTCIKTSICKHKQVLIDFNTKTWFNCIFIPMQFTHAYTIYRNYKNNDMFAINTIGSILTSIVNIVDKKLAGLHHE
ncbi:hypothetical protein nvc1_049 [Namao virus]|nr:hypothetical protein nvc1_049 [Namao virus]